MNRAVRSGPAVGRRIGVVGCACAAALVLATGQSLGQETVTVGRGEREPRVIVNLEALDGGAVRTPRGGLRPPPPEPPRSHLTVLPPASEQQVAEPESRLLAPQPEKPEREPAPAAAEPQTAEAQPAEKPPAPEPAGDETAAAPAEPTPEIPPTPELPERSEAEKAPGEAAATPEAGAEEPPPQPPEAEEATAERQQTAARTTGPGKVEQFRITFAGSSAELADEAKQQLTGLAQQMQRDEGMRVQLLAYAHGTEDSASRARRLSLSRALAVRSFLIDRGIRSTRMDVRALGNQAEDGPSDRVDIVPAER